MSRRVETVSKKATMLVKIHPRSSIKKARPNTRQVSLVNLGLLLQGTNTKSLQIMKRQRMITYLPKRTKRREIRKRRKKIKRKDEIHNYPKALKMIRRMRKMVNEKRKNMTKKRKRKKAVKNRLPKLKYPLRNYGRSKFPSIPVPSLAILHSNLKVPFSNNNSRPA